MNTFILDRYQKHFIFKNCDLVSKNHNCSIHNTNTIGDSVLCLDDNVILRNMKTYHCQAQQGFSWISGLDIWIK